MNRQYYLDLAKSGLRMPIGADLVLKDKEDHEGIIHEGERLGRVVEEAARLYRTPLAVPLMDLEVEKHWLLKLLDVPADEIPTHHFHGVPTGEMAEAVSRRLGEAMPSRAQAGADAVRYIAEQTDLIPIGMAIGPFSLMTKLLDDPITPIYLAGTGLTADEDSEVKAVEAVLELGIQVILRSLALQIDAGAKTVVIAEPAGNKVYLSPKQIDAGSDIFDRYVMKYNRRIKALLESRGVDLFFHCCGELIPQMVQAYTTLDPAIISLGSSRVLWEDAAIVPKQTVMFGNLPSKRFYSDSLVTREDVVNLSCELITKMREVGHPFILGSECDVLSVPGSADTIKSKCQAFIECEC